MSQINIHFVLYKGREQLVEEVVEDIQKDERLAKLNAIVFLNLKKKGRGCNGFTNLSLEEFKNIIDLCDEKKIRYGMDSCSGYNYLKLIEGKSNYQQLKEVIETCCASAFSSYTNCHAEYVPCSFLEGSAEDGWNTGIPILEYNHFSEIGNSRRIQTYRHHVLSLGGKPPCSFLKDCT